MNSFLYDTFMIPFENFAGLGRCRKYLIPFASGAVLEAGPGTGANGRYYNPSNVEKLILCAPGPDRGNLLSGPYRKLEAEYVEADVQKLPFGSNSFDTVVATLLFCSVADPLAGLCELRRVLKPGGKYIFIEHIKPSAPLAANIAAALTPYWKQVAGGCHLDRETVSTMKKAGFSAISSCPYTKGVFTGGVAV